MKKYNFRWVDDPENQNEGLTAGEINALQKEMQLEFPEAYIVYLQHAGKNSNVFPVETGSEKLKTIQKELEIELEQLKWANPKKVLCIRKDQVYVEHFRRMFESYLFFDLSENTETPKLYLFEEICINEGWSAFQKRVKEYKGGKFTDIINDRTNDKYGRTLMQHVLNFPMYIILGLITIIVTVIFGFQLIIEKIKNQ
jgi:hypothetical protein